MSTSLVSELEQLANALGSEPGGQAEISLTTVAEKVARSLGVKIDEVAILSLSSKWRHLQFLVPEELRKVGFIPLSSPNSLAAHTARDSRPEIVNNFASIPHATVFEGVPLGDRGTRRAIQKIMSAPILSGDKVIGVIQVSRKGKNAAIAGPDFTSDDLGRVLDVCRPLGRLLQHLSNES